LVVSARARAAALNEENEMTINDYSFSWDYQTRSTELQDIAAMDRLAAELAPPSALRRYAASRRVRGVRITDRWTDLWRRNRARRLHHA
jgi:hypothetical protein